MNIRNVPYDVLYQELRRRDRINKLHNKIDEIERNKLQISESYDRRIAEVRAEIESLGGTVIVEPA